LRGEERFVAAQPIAGAFGAAAVTVRDVSAQGVQIEHTQPLRLGSKGRLTFKVSDVSVVAFGISIWSHLSKTPNEQGKYLYRSGIRIEAGIDEFAAALQTLIDRQLVHLDIDSMARKHQRILDRQTDRKSQIKVIRSNREIPSDQVLLVQHARERLRAHPEEALKWYNRAKFALSQGSSLTDPLPYRQEVLAVWEYLERTIELQTIVEVFEMTRGPQPAQP
jgi:hypothetical protein